LVSIKLQLQQMALKTEHNEQTQKKTFDFEIKFNTT